MPRLGQLQLARRLWACHSGSVSGDSWLVEEREAVPWMGCPALGARGNVSGATPPAGSGRRTNEIQGRI